MIDLKQHVNKNDKLVIAVSGGVDSVVLLDILANKRPKKNLIIAHVDHGIRKESGKDEDFVKKLSKNHGIEYRSTKLNLKKLDENTAREARYSYLRGVKDEFGAKYIVTAHHLDDQLETILLNLTRGTGPLKLWGMQTVSNGIYRPLLDASKKEIEAYARKKKLKYVKDITNDDISYNRNLIRHKVVPELKKINKNVLNNVKESIELSNELNEFIDFEVNILLGEVLSVQDLKKAHPFIAKETIKRKLHEMMGQESNIYKKNVEEVYNLLSKPGTKRTEINGYVIEKDYESLRFGICDEKDKKEVKLSPGETVKFNNHKLKCSFGKGESGKNNILIAEDFEYNLKVRNWEEGDKIKTISGTKKLSDVFTDAKISQHERKKWPIVVSGKEILWVPKLSASIHGKSCSKKNCLIIEVE